VNALRSALYVPGDRPERFERALRSEADAIVLDLEDAVAPGRKEFARGAVSEFLGSPATKPVFVRVNGLASGLTSDDLRALTARRIDGIRLPKVEDAAGTAAAVRLLEAQELAVDLWCLLESARAVELAYEIACSPRVAAIGLGEADLRASLGATEVGLDYARSRCVVAARAAGLPAPMLAVYTLLGDEQGLRRSTERGRALGFFGRSAIHPEQLGVINEVFTPSAEEVAAAQEIVLALGEAAADGPGAVALPDGRFVDRAVAEQARSVVALAEHLARGAA
jgi:citrate lyase subunit beta/citryl-CoA lyase